MSTEGGRVSKKKCPKNTKNVQKCLQITRNVHVQKFPKMSNNVLKYPKISKNVQKCVYVIHEWSLRNKTTDDVDVTLVVCHDKDSSLNGSLRGQDKLRLNYYIIISRHDIYPTSYDNTRQSGIFR